MDDTATVCPVCKGAKVTLHVDLVKATKTTTPPGDEP